jgi:hypothetical protein
MDIENQKMNHLRRREAKTSHGKSKTTSRLLEHKQQAGHSIRDHRHHPIETMGRLPKHKPHTGHLIRDHKQDTQTQTFMKNHRYYSKQRFDTQILNTILFSLQNYFLKSFKRFYIGRIVKRVTTIIT